MRTKGHGVRYLLLRIDLYLGKNLETNVTKAVALQRIGKHASTTIELLLETVFSIRPVQSGYKEENWGNQFS
jgi:hypothetical protein